MLLEEEMELEQGFILHASLCIFQLMAKQEMWNVNTRRKYEQVKNYQLKHHLARTPKDIEACIAIHEDVKNLMLNYLPIVAKFD